MHGLPMALDAAGDRGRPGAGPPLDGPGGGAAPTIFQEQWWLQIASEGAIQTVQVAWDGQVVGALSVMPVRRFGLRQLMMPPYTRTLGPVFTLPESRPFKRGQNIRRVTEGLVRQLPPHDHFHQTLDPADESPMAFSLLGFSTVQCFTFVVPRERTPAEVWRRCDQKTRNIIKSAEQRLTVVRSAAFDGFIEVSLAEHPAGQNIHDFALLTSLFEACVQRQCGAVLLAMDGAGSAVAAVALIWGRDTLYFWLSARRRGAASGGANALLLWRGIELAHQLGLRFDCDGYSSVGAAKFLASFGEAPVARVEVMRSGWRRDSAEFVKRSWLRLRGQGAGAGWTGCSAAPQYPP
jgi:hypothetical protein